MMLLLVVMVASVTTSVCVSMLRPLASILGIAVAVCSVSVLLLLTISASSSSAGRASRVGTWPVPAVVSMYPRIV